jgi:hypothetical protein
MATKRSADLSALGPSVDEDPNESKVPLVRFFEKGVEVDREVWTDDYKLPEGRGSIVKSTRKEGRHLIVELSASMLRCRYNDCDYGFVSNEQVRQHCLKFHQSKPLSRELALSLATEVRGSCVFLDCCVVAL